MSFMSDAYFLENDARFESSTSFYSNVKVR